MHLLSILSKGAGIPAPKIVSKCTFQHAIGTNNRVLNIVEYRNLHRNYESLLLSYNLE